MYMYLYNVNIAGGTGLSVGKCLLLQISRQDMKLSVLAYMYVVYHIWSISIIYTVKLVIKTT